MHQACCAIILIFRWMRWWLHLFRIVMIYLTMLMSGVVHTHANEDMDINGYRLVSNQKGDFRERMPKPFAAIFVSEF
ncbi:MAG: hypothetical protein CL578_01000 [Alteromonadaceae bacterium]|nr:hypothetical protein [Alteromonadaceae bacterium]